jgi:hypothetical protein
MKRLALVVAFAWLFFAVPSDAQVQPVFPPIWTVRAWFVNPLTGLDGNSCTSSGSPCKTFGEIFIHRLQTTSPTFVQQTIFTLQASQSGTLDAIFFTPHLANGGQAALVGTLTVACTGTAGTVTPKARTGGGTLLTVASFPACAVQGSYVLNTTRNSYASVNTISGTATMSQPIPAAVVTTIGTASSGAEDNTWTTGDSLTVYAARPSVNLKQWEPVGGDFSSGGSQGSVGWVQWVQIADSSGDGASEYPAMNDAASTVYSGVQFVPRVHQDSFHGRGFASVFMGCDFDSAFVAYGGTSYLYGGILRSTAGNGGGAVITLDGDLIALGTQTWAASATYIGFLYLAATLNVYQGFVRLNSGGILYGTAGTTLFPGGVFYNATLSSWATVYLLTGTNQFGNATTGSAFSVGTGLWTSGIAITAANIDSNVGLQDPPTGARFCNGA